MPAVKLCCDKILQSNWDCWLIQLAFIAFTLLFGRQEEHPAYKNWAMRCISSLQSAVEQVLDILMDILSWEIAKVVSPCFPRGLWSHIVIRVFLLLGTVCPRHPPYPVLTSCPLSRAFPSRNLGMWVVAIVPQPSANLSHQQTPPVDAADTHHLLLH